MPTLTPMQMPATLPAPKPAQTQGGRAHISARAPAPGQGPGRARSHSNNPRVSRSLLAVTAVEALVLLVAGGGLFLFPSVLRAIWPWSLPPFNAAYLGGVYLAALTAAALLVRSGRWSPARVVVPMILVFTVVVLAVSLLHLDRFERGSPSTWLWFVLYLGIPANAAYHVWRYRGLPPAGERRPGTLWRVVLPVQVVALGAYGVALLFAPAAAGAFWPWPVDVFHAQVYSAAFFAPALGALLLLRAVAPAEARAVGLSQAALGALPVVGLVAVDTTLHRVDWTAGGTWLWLGLHAALAAVGAALVVASRPARRRAPGGLPVWPLISAPSLAALLGVSFVVAGGAGFLPALTPPAPAAAPPLAVPAGYGYLLGLAPLFGHDVWLHGVEAAGAWYVGFVHPARPKERVRL
jgi:hypothetical protein